MPKLFYREGEWDVSLTKEFGNDAIYCRKTVEIVTEEKQLNRAFTINFIISKNRVDEMMRNLLYKKSILDRIKSKFSSSPEELLPSQLNILTHFCIYFTDCNINEGKVRIKLYTNYNEIIETTCSYKYGNETDPVIDFYPNNRFDANKVFKAFLENIIQKVEIVPIERNTFDRMYFDIESIPLLLKERIQSLEKEIGFIIKFHS